MNDIRTLYGKNIAQTLRWDKRYFQLAKLVSTWSKDPTTKCGAVITQDNYITGIGFNGFPRCVEDTEEKLHDREYKRKLMLHAEMNAIAAAQGKGETIYIYPCLPCTTCMTLIMQVGINKIVAGDAVIDAVWGTSFVEKELEGAGIELILMPI